MMTIIKIILPCFFLISCKSISKKEIQIESTFESDVVIAFGSCNKQNSTNVLWDDILLHKPIAWIWGGDVVYADTDNMAKLKKDYDKQLQQKGYNELITQTKVLGTWDDHDYGLNDGGEEFTAKAQSQQLFLDFIGVPSDNERRYREGVYYSEILNTNKGSIKVIVLDTRYFRTQLTPSKTKEKRYQPNEYGKGTILGDLQWQWFEKTLNSSQSDFNLIISSIQLLSGEHGFETWRNFPHETDKMQSIITKSRAKGVVVLSGDRHISEFSKMNIEGLTYPLIDFTSSGLTHSYKSFSNEPNKYRVGEVISEISFGLLKFNFNNCKIQMEMRGENNVLQQELTQAY